MVADIRQTPEFLRWFAGSKVVDQHGQPVKLYRGLHGPHVDQAERMQGRPGYAMFFSTNPHVAATYSGPITDGPFSELPDNTGAIFPVYVKCQHLHEFPVKVGRDGYRRFDMFAFDDHARRLGPGEGLVVRGIVDAGPRGSLTIDPEMRYSHLSDTYSFGPGTSIKSAVGNAAFNAEDPRMTETINTSRGLKMTKTFREILAERDDEFTYFVRSTANIHDPAIFEKMRLSWLPYVVKSFEVDAYKPISKSNPIFPGEPNSPTYAIKVVTGLPIPKAFIQSLAMDSHIHVSHLNIDPEGDFDPVNKPEEVPSADAQMAVGHKRIGEFIKELQKDRKTREEMTSTREVYESFFTTHRGLEDVLKKPVRKGYYMVEASREDGKTYLRAEGPFETRPDDKAYHDRISVTNVNEIKETTAGNRFGVEIIAERIQAR